MRVAVLGAGLQGVCVALELALRGVEVDLYDREDAAVTQASLHNEGMRRPVARPLRLRLPRAPSAAHVR